MTHFSRVLLLIPILLATCALSQAQAASTVSLTCSPTKRLQAAIDSAAAGVVTTINLSSNCVENIVVPAGKTIIVKGNLGGSNPAQIIPKDTTLPAVNSHGDITIQNVTLSNSNSGTSVADSLVQAERGGIIQLIGDNLLGGSAPDSVVGIWDNATGYIFNTNISGGGSDAIDLANAGSLILGGNPAYAPGPNGFVSNISNSVFCGPGSSLFIRVKKNTNDNGQVNIVLPISQTAPQPAISTNGCSASLWNKTSTQSNLTITGRAGPGIGLNRSSLSMQTALVTSGQNVAIQAIQSTAQILNSALPGSGAGDVNAGPGSAVTIDGWAGANTIPGALVGETLSCWPGTNSGNIFVAPDGIDLGGTSYETLLANNPCATRTDQ